MSKLNNEARPARTVSRRRLMQGAVAAGGLAATGIGGATIGASPAYALGTHPGMLHTQADFDRMYAHVSANEEPWRAGWEKLIANSHAQSSWSPWPTDTIIRGGDGQNYPQLYNDVHAAYQNALRWRVSGNTAYRDTAVNICNAWSGTLTTVTGNADRFLAAGIYGYQFANAAELVRDAPGFNLGRFQQMMADVFYPLNDWFLVNHNDACITNYWANWDLCNMASIMAIGILNDDQAMFDYAVDYFWNGEGNGSIVNAIPFVYDGGLAQWQESGRDQAHSMMGIGLMATIMEMAWNQGLNLYAARDNAFLKAAEYTARYNLGNNDLPFTTYSWGTGQNCAYREQTVISEGGRGQVRPVWEMVYHHYWGRLGYDTPNVSAIARQISPEGGGGDYGTTSGGFDALGFGTLAYVREGAGSLAYNRIQSYNFQDRYVRHLNFDVRIDPNVSPAADARFRLVPGLADSGAISFESVNFPGYYLRHWDFDFRLEANDGSAAFAPDATFRQVAGLADASWSSFQSYNYSGRYLRHADYVLRLDPISTTTERQDATFRITD